MSEPATAPGRPSRWRYLWWLVLLLLGILIGWLLAPRCQHCSSASAATGEVAATPSQGSAAGGKAGGGKASGTPDSVPLKDGGGTPDIGAAPGDNSGQDSTMGMGQAKLHPSGADLEGSGGGSDEKSVPLDATGGGKMDHGPRQDLPDSTYSQVQRADDFRYDKTGLPRYPVAVSAFGSTFAYDRGTSGSYHTTCAIATSSAFQDVVDWYKAHLPAGWTMQGAADVAALGQQVSVANIMKTLTQATQGSGAPPPDASPPATPSAHPLSVAMFSAPAGSTGEPMVMIKQEAGKPVQITMSKGARAP